MPGNKPNNVKCQLNDQKTEITENSFDAVKCQIIYADYIKCHINDPKDRNTRK